MAFEDLDVWKRAANLSAEIYTQMHESRDFGFRDQITRSGLSIPSNIAEGLERATDKEKVRFLSIAKGSAAELRTQIYIGIKINYIPNDIGKRWVQETKELSAMSVGLMKSINAVS